MHHVDVWQGIYVGTHHEASTYTGQQKHEKAKKLFMPRVVFEPTIPLLEPPKTLPVLGARLQRSTSPILKAQTQ
jgi:hypothetical protein